jgi:beta-1,4-mannooligosaccharide/beta-1,4-mannosyl-N-acetylglucosamine phosphorylase
VFNSAVAPFGDKFAGVFRCDTRAVHMNIFSGFSDDGYNWKIDHEPIAPVPAPGMDEGVTALEYRYDPRVVLMEGRYYVSWCNGYHGPTIGLAYTDDFRTYYQIENAFLPFNRNGVLFPRRINNKYIMLSRPSDNGHTPFGDIFLSESPDLIHWGRHRHVMGTRSVSWESTKIGAGPVPIETDEGWLLIYHGVLTSCNGYVYRMGVALLDIDEPWKVIYRAKDYLFTPAELYEQVGEVPNVVFPCAALTDAETGRIAIYYGCADTVTGLAFTTTDGLIDFAREHS